MITRTVKTAPTRKSQIIKIGLITVATLVTTVTSISLLAFDSPYSPLLIGGWILLSFFVLISISKPVITLYAALLTVLLPIGLFPTTIQSYLNRILTVAAFIVWCSYVIAKRHRIVWTSTALFMLAFLVWSSLTVLWAENLEIAIYELGGYALRFVLFLFLIANEINTQKSLDGMMHTLAIAGWLFIVAGLATLATQGYEFGSRFKILESNENSLGSIFPVLAVGTIWLAARPRNPRRAMWIIVSLAFILLSFVLIALSGSRGGAISWLVTMLVLLFWRQTRLWGMWGLLILVAAAIIAPLVFSTTIERFTNITSDSDSLLGGRDVLARAAWLLIQDHPLTGVGIGNAPRVMMSIIRLFRSIDGDKAVIHNPILTVWLETGIIGTLLYLGVFTSAIWSFLQQFRRCRTMGSEDLIPYFCLVTAGFLGFFISWIKGGGMELHHSYFLTLALLLIPSQIKIEAVPTGLPT